MSFSSNIAFDRKQLTVLGLQLSGVATAAIHPLLPLVLLAGAAITAFLISHQQFLLILLVDSSLFKPLLIQTFPMLETVDPTVVLSLILMISLAWQLFDRDVWRRLGEQQWVIITFFVWVFWMLAAVLYAPQVEWALMKAWRFAFFVSIIFLAPFILIKNDADNGRIARMFLLVGIFGAIAIGIQTVLSIRNLGAGAFMGRQTILGTNPIAAARLLTTCAALAGVMILKHGFKAKWICLFLGFLIGALFTGSRGPIVSLVLTLMIIGIILGPGSRLRLVGTSLMILLVISAVVQTLPEGFIARFSELAVTEVSISDRGFNAMNTVEHRYHMWGMATDLWLSDARHFLIGEGTAGYAKLFPWRDFRYPHNLIFEVLAEFGFLGLIIFLMHIAIGFSCLWQITVKDYSDRLLFWLAGLMNFGIATMFSGDLNDNRMLWFFLAGLIVTVKLDLDRSRELT